MVYLFFCAVKVTMRRFFVRFSANETWRFCSDSVQKRALHKLGFKMTRMPLPVNCVAFFPSPRALPRDGNPRKLERQFVLPMRKW